MRTAVLGPLILIIVLAPSAALSFMPGPNDAVPVGPAHNQRVCKKETGHALQNRCRLPDGRVIRGNG